MSGSLLVVDDDAVVREALVEALVDAGYDVRAADNGVRAVALLAKRAPYVVLADVHRVVFVNVKVPRPWEQPNNAVLADGVQ